jgi:hypothetical protein
VAPQYLHLCAQAVLLILLFPRVSQARWMWDASTWWGSDFNFLDRKFQSLMQELSNPAASSLLSGEISSAQQLLCVVEGIEADGEGGGTSLTL